MAEDQILVVDADEEASNLIKGLLTEAGFTVTTVISAKEALDKIKVQPPRLVLFEHKTSDQKGAEFCKELRGDNQLKGIGIILMGADAETTEICAGLDAGADDFLSKPPDPQLLLSRLNAIKRRLPEPSNAPAGTIVIDELEINSTERSVIIRGEPLQLSDDEFNILEFFVNNRGKVFTPYQISQLAQSGDNLRTSDETERNLNSLKEKLGGTGRYLENIIGIGHRFRD